MAATSINCLAVVLKELDWSYTRLIAELRRQAAVDGIVLPKTESLIPLKRKSPDSHPSWRPPAMGVLSVDGSTITSSRTTSTVSS